MSAINLRIHEEKSLSLKIHEDESLDLPIHAQECQGIFNIGHYQITTTAMKSPDEKTCNN